MQNFLPRPYSNAILEGFSAFGAEKYFFVHSKRLGTFF